MELKNFIRIYDDVIPRGVCAEVIQAYETCGLSRAAEVGEKQEADRSMRDCDVLPLFDPALEKRSPRLHQFVPDYVQRFRGRLMEYVGAFQALSKVGSFSLTQLDILKYQRGQGFYHWHTDATRSTTERVLSALLYLNDIEAGGETEFSYAETKIQARAGRLAIFPSAWMFEHRGVRPVGEDKYVIVSWMSFPG